MISAMITHRSCGFCSLLCSGLGSVGRGRGRGLLCYRSFLGGGRGRCFGGGRLLRGSSRLLRGSGGGSGSSGCLLSLGLCLLGLLFLLFHVSILGAYRSSKARPAQLTFGAAALVAAGLASFFASLTGPDGPVTR